MLIKSWPYQRTTRLVKARLLVLWNFSMQNTHNSLFYLTKKKSSLSKNYLTCNYQSHEPITEKRNKFPRSLILSVLCCFSFFYTAKEKLNLNFGLFSVAHALDDKKKSCRNSFNFVADVVEQCGNAVVCIESQIYRFGREVVLPRGSGFIIKEDGLILTNAHVVMQKPRSFLVKLKDGRIYSGRIEDIDIESDLATIRINEKNLPVMKLGSSYDLRSGEWVIAIGSPLALDNSVSAGVVSAPKRSSEDLGLQSNDMYYIQTDASLAFGNSGGPLVNLDGEVIGVNSLKMVTGISLAIPIEFVKRFLENNEKQRKKEKDSQLDSNDKQKGYMGIVMLTLNKCFFDQLNQKQYKIPDFLINKVIICEVSDNTPAFRSGLQPGDIITEVNGQEVEGVKSIYRALKSGSPLLLKIFRKQELFYVTVIPDNF